MDDRAFLKQAVSVQDDSSQGRRSMFVWNRYFFNSGAFPALAEVLTANQVDRVYQDIPVSCFRRQELPEMVANMAALDIQVAALAGDSRWLEEGLEEYRGWIDALHQYNRDHPGQAITAVALDVESHTLPSFKKDPAAGFAAYAKCMEQAYQYAHERGLAVIQVIPTTLDAIDRERFEWFVEHCCDELSIMNYGKDTELSAIWNEVHTCRRLGVPVETIFETMPADGEHGVTREMTYYYDGRKALDKAVEELREVYGTSLGIAYHHFGTMYHVHTGLYLAKIYPYARTRGDKNNQIQVGDQIWLKGAGHSRVPAWLFSPYRESAGEEYYYLAVGVRLNTGYSVLLEDRDYRVTTTRKLRFKKESGRVVYSESFHAAPKSP